ncbi:hypothetical protein KVR01_006982 [Diaporthe batatas]|uniref:uncharacterized protein n=1 Tax=Diaporthe batatas TaxID=748121 RepID=UPI001D03C7F0|nr:uncharacterized protein KVR01_006982 [Diaporthe batatas]KAG8163685.1 hypothetical protein KVR01_006982 [Diaporthe batatas]
MPRDSCYSCNASPRPRRRRSAFRDAGCCLIIIWALLFAGLNIARLLSSEIGLRNTPMVNEALKPPNYYEELGVSPLISEEDLRGVWKRYSLEHHPDKVSLTAHNLDEAEDYIRKSKMFETLLKGRLRCEYDRENRIKGRWQATRCREAFKEEYRELLQEELEMKQTPLTSESRMKAEPGARPKAPAVTVELGPQPENHLPSVDSIPGVKALKSGAAEVWNYGIVYNWVYFKALVADCSEKIYSFLASFSNIHFGARRP